MKLLVQHVLAKRSERADEEEEGKTIVHLAVRELALRTNDAPDDGRRAEDRCAGTTKAVLLVLRTDVGNVGKHPGLNSKLHCACDSCSEDLASKHRSRTFEVFSAGGQMR